MNISMLENIERQSENDNPEKLATQGTQDEEKQSKSTLYASKHK